MPPNEPLSVNARGMKCPWPALRAARAMRGADAVLVEADDPVAPAELEALASAQGWAFEALGEHRFSLHRSG
ncbi:sulfurtransferase TusA family protein [Sphingobium sp. Ant17]|uniref:sulfurtransferase TusA family protein n=1 Tax=Sphingobium sp. Ant17 TaxID=1461752 RepID=UPI0004535311|nr:sulfurtransferase TusA family protein [Sphingobium sp. Ant17]EXS71639.1 redox protein [Sphingobium sp. Ant17]